MPSSLVNRICIDIRDSAYTIGVCRSRSNALFVSTARDVYGVEFGA